MPVIDFEQIVRETPQTAPKKVYGEVSTNTKHNLYNNEENKPSEFEGVKATYRKAYFQKKQLELQLKEVTKICEDAKNEIIEKSGYKDYEDLDMKLTQSKRTGNVDWKRLQASHPEVNVDSFRNQSTLFWTLKLKVKE